MTRRASVASPIEPDSGAVIDGIAALKAKIERGFDLDREDVAQMIEGGLVKPGRLRELFAEIEAELGRFPAVDAATLRSQLEEALDSPRRSPEPSGP